MNPRAGIMLKTLLPIFIGVAVVAFLMARDFNVKIWESIHWTSASVFGIVLALLFTIGRETGLAWRFRTLSDNQLSWKSSFKITMLCEFVSAITPTTAGGSAVSMVFMKREGIDAGRGTALTLTTIFLDELFFVVLCPAIFIIKPASKLFAFASDAADKGMLTAFWVVWGVICIWTVVLFIGIFIKPDAVGKCLGFIFHLKFLRKKRQAVAKLTYEMSVTGTSLRYRKLSWWIRAAAATAMSWTSRFLVVNALFLALAPWADQIMVFCRQFVVWTLLTVSPTPGGSGVSEWLFTSYYGDLLPTAASALVIAVLWRLISYYIYLAFGAFMVPTWIKQGLKSKL